MWNDVLEFHHRYREPYRSRCSSRRRVVVREEGPSFTTLSTFLSAVVLVGKEVRSAGFAEGSMMLTVIQGRYIMMYGWVVPRFPWFQIGLQYSENPVEVLDKAVQHYWG